MATTDAVNMQLFHRLKLKFPEIPDGVIMSCIQKFPNDLQNCTACLAQLSGNYLYGSATELALNKQDKDHFNHYETTRLYHPQLPPNTINNRPPTPRYLMQKSLPCEAYYTPAMGNYGGAPSMMRAVGGGYQMQRPPMDGQAQSAPVMPLTYEPFLPESFNKVSMGGGGGISPVPHHSPSQMGMPALVPGSAHHHHHQHQHHPGSAYMQNDYESQQRRQFNQYDWEMHVSYNQALVLHQRAQMNRLQQKLNEDKQTLHCIRNEVSTLEVEMYNRIASKKHPAIFNLEQMKKLREETRQLRVDCFCMSREVDYLQSGKKKSEGFYEHINPGQSGSIGTSPTPSIGHLRAPSPPPPPHRQRETEEDDHQWSCSTCTFLNNPALDKCEICEMPRLMLASGFG